MTDAGDAIWLNPPLPPVAPAAGSEGALRVGMIDSGVNYLLPQINQRLARTDSGELVGYDFWDLDPLPFDSHPTRSPFFVQRHGTRTASLLLSEAPGIELVPYRYPRPDMSRMESLLEHAVENDVSIIGMPLGGNNPDDWTVFGKAALAHPDTLFVVSAGNNGRDIDQVPVYPAVLPLDNVLVVTSADDFVRPAERTNWGTKSVDYLLPAEQLVVTDYNGESTLASGSSYAVSRLTALAANIKSSHRDWNAAQIKREIKRGFAVSLGTDSVAEGYIPDPLAVQEVHINRLPATRLTLESSKSATVAEQGYLLSMDVLVLDSRWNEVRVRRLLEQAFDTLAACAITPGELNLRLIEAADYLSHLSVGGAYTLLGAEPAKVVTSVLANDTRMLDPYEAEAFGLGNTRTRPWLRNTVWLVESVHDEGVALAHEVFHVLANDGAHVDQPGNLMQGITHPENTMLTPEQCSRAAEFGLRSGLLARAQ